MLKQIKFIQLIAPIVFFSLWPVVQISLRPRIATKKKSSFWRRHPSHTTQTHAELRWIAYTKSPSGLGRWSDQATSVVFVTCWGYADVVRLADWSQPSNRCDCCCYESQCYWWIVGCPWLWVWCSVQTCLMEREYYITT